MKVELIPLRRKENNMFINVIMLTIGFALLIKGADLLVDGASNIAKKFHIPEIIIGLTVVAIGTSMPELVVSTTSALQGHSDIALGNIVGSNIANLFLILGACSIIRPLVFKKETIFIENPITILATGLLFFLCLNNGQNEITRIDLTRNAFIMALTRHINEDIWK